MQNTISIKKDNHRVYVATPFEPPKGRIYYVEYKKMVELRRPAQLLIAYIFFNELLILVDEGGQNHTNTIRLNVGLAAMALKGSTTRASLLFIRRGLSDLLDKEVLARTSIQDLYWLNRKVITVINRN